MSKKIVASAFGLVVASFSIASASDSDFYFTPKLFYGQSTLDDAQKATLAQHYQAGKIQPNISNFSLGFDLGYKINPYIFIEVDILEFSAHNAPSEENTKQIHKKFAKLADAGSGDGDSDSFDMGSLTPPPSINEGTPSDDSGDVIPNGDKNTPSEEKQEVDHGGILNNTDTFTLSRTVLWVSCKTVLYRVNAELHTWAKAGLAFVAFHAHSADSKTAQSADIEKKNSMSFIPALGLGISYQLTPNVGFDFSGNYIFGIKKASLEYPGIGFVSAGVRFSFE